MSSKQKTNKHGYVTNRESRFLISPISRSFDSRYGRSRAYESDVGYGHGANEWDEFQDEGFRDRHRRSPRELQHNENRRRY